MISAPAASASSTCARLCASTSIGISRLRVRIDVTALRDAAGEADVVVLDQDAVVQAAAMIDAAAGTHGVLLQRAQRRRRLARVEHGDASVGRVDELARQRRDARRGAAGS